MDKLGKASTVAVAARFRVKRLWEITPMSSKLVSNTTTKTMALRLASLVVCTAAVVQVCGAQQGQVPTPIRPRSAPYSFHKRSKAAKTSTASTPANLVSSTTENTSELPTVEFGNVPQGSVGFKSVDIAVPAQNPISRILITDDDDTSGESSSVFMGERNNRDPKDLVCSGSVLAAKEPGGTCTIVIGFMPSDDHTSVNATMTVTFADGTQKSESLTGTGDKALPCQLPTSHFFPLNRDLVEGKLYPVLPANVSKNLAWAVYKDFGNPVRKTLVNCFYSTDNVFSYFTQAQTIYNSVSGATTLNAQLGSLNFINGMQVTLGTNPQIGTPASNSSTTTSTVSSSIPTLSAASASQATQNIQNGGSVFGVGLMPIFFHQSAYSLVTLSGELKEGVDFQKFNNTSTTATNPSTHTFVGLETFLQLTSSNNATNSSGAAGSIFVGAKYGYDLMNHAYSIQNGFGGRINSQLAQVSGGVLLNGVVKIAAYRGFGPSQRYIDSTTMTQKTMNNFQTWSVAISYQKKSSSSK